MTTIPAPAGNTIRAEKLLKRLPAFATGGDEQSVDRIAYELLNLLMDVVDADIGQISLFPAGDRVEKVCIVKDGEPWIRKDTDLPLYNPRKGFAFFRRGAGYGSHALRIVAWLGEEMMAVYFPEFTPARDSILCDRSAISYPIEGDGHCRRLRRFREKISNYVAIRRKEQKFLLKVIDSIRSYVVYPLHMLDQDLGVIPFVPG